MLTKERAALIQKIVELNLMRSMMLLSDESEDGFIQDLTDFFDINPSTIDDRRGDFLQAGISADLLQREEFGRFKVLHINFGKLKIEKGADFGTILKAIYLLLSELYQDIVPKLTDGMHPIPVLEKDKDFDFAGDTHESIWCRVKLQHAVRELANRVRKIEKKRVVLIVTNYEVPFTYLKSEADPGKMGWFLDCFYKLTFKSDYVYSAFAVGKIVPPWSDLFLEPWRPNLGFRLSDLRKDVAKKVRSDQPERISGNPYSVYQLSPNAEESGELQAVARSALI